MGPFCAVMGPFYPVPSRSGDSGVFCAGSAVVSTGLSIPNHNINHKLIPLESFFRLTSGSHWKCQRGGVRVPSCREQREQREREREISCVWQRRSIAIHALLSRRTQYDETRLTRERYLLARVQTLTGGHDRQSIRISISQSRNKSERKINEIDERDRYEKIYYENDVFA